MNFFFLLAEEVRSHMAQLGFRRFGDMIGRSDKLAVEYRKWLKELGVTFGTA